MLVMKSHLERKYYDYELNELFQMFKYVSHSFARDAKTLKLIEDTTAIRA